MCTWLYCSSILLWYYFLFSLLVSRIVSRLVLPCDIPVTSHSVLIQEFYSNMYGIDHSVTHFFTRVQGTRFPITPQLVVDVLWVPRVEFPDYPSCERLRTVSKDELMYAFCECPSDWGDHQFTLFKPFAKGPRFLNIVMTFVLHPLSHYNSITESRARFLLSFLEHLTIDFPSHFHSFHYRCSLGFGIPW